MVSCLHDVKGFLLYGLYSADLGKLSRLHYFLLCSIIFKGGASGLGLITSLCTGYTMETFSDAPLTKSTSPSDFWGRRWDRPVQSALSRGVFRPLRKAGYSRNLAAVTTFVVSGLLHEYVLYFISLRPGRSSIGETFR